MKAQHVYPENFHRAGVALISDNHNAGEVREAYTAGGSLPSAIPLIAYEIQSSSGEIILSRIALSKDNLFVVGTHCFYIQTDYGAKRDPSSLDVDDAKEALRKMEASLEGRFQYEAEIPKGNGAHEKKLVRVCGSIDELLNMQAAVSGFH